MIILLIFALAFIAVGGEQIHVGMGYFIAGIGLLILLILELQKKEEQ